MLIVPSAGQLLTGRGQTVREVGIKRGQHFAICVPDDGEDILARVTLTLIISYTPLQYGTRGDEAESHCPRKSQAESNHLKYAQSSTRTEENPGNPLDKR